MTHTNFTPGPWAVVGQDTIGSYPSIAYPGIDAGEHTIVIFGTEDSGDDAGIRGNSPEEAHANAHLIAAAPDMYMVLQKALKYLDFTEMWDRDILTLEIRAVLKEAGQ